MPAFAGPIIAILKPSLILSPTFWSFRIFSISLLMFTESILILLITSISLIYPLVIIPLQLLSEADCAIRVSIGETTKKKDLEKFVSVWSSYNKKR